MKRHNPNFKTYFTQIAVVSFTQLFRTVDSTFSFQNVWPIKRKAVYTFVLVHIFIHVLVAHENQIGLQLVFFKTTSIILVNLQVASGNKFYWLPPDNENTAVMSCENTLWQAE